MLCTFSFGCFQIYQNKSVKNIGIYYIGMIVPIKCMPKISAVGLFCLDKFENNLTRTRTTFFRTSKLTELYFSIELYCISCQYIVSCAQITNVFKDDQISHSTKKCHVVRSLMWNLNSFWGLDDQTFFFSA